MKNKKIIICIIVVVAAVLSLISVNYAGNKIKLSTNESNIVEERNNDDTKKEEAKEETPKVEESKDSNKAEDNQSKEETNVQNKNNDNNKSEDNKINTNPSANIKNQTEENKNTENNKASISNEPKKENIIQKEEQKQPKKEVVYIEIINGTNGQSLGSGQVTLDQNRNLNDIMNSFLSNNGIKYINKNGYISMMYGLSEFDEGPTSGWCYYINGNKGTVGIKGYTPKPGDKIVWKYLKDGLN
ncbi:DUF4430 domain-containing protein [Clostridium fallax]|uniref:Transcobalamin-like C-terminal domain-containing protein n=1 Tax=Clostridium fallax TaxID=1533 RepID=A0A1M4W5C1_9CLOT|nr:DUF4430 domain-containing protein [Clostridium fallax]SHE76350.1 protein of unknown function [Clostridium fallax]SQB22886.1 surface/cell-adhesion protein [Clostridium fallax]